MRFLVFMIIGVIYFFIFELIYYFIIRPYHAKYEPWNIDSKAREIISNADEDYLNTAFVNFQNKKRYSFTLKHYNRVIAREVYLINKKKGNDK